MISPTPRRSSPGRTEPCADKTAYAYSLCCTEIPPVALRSSTTTGLTTGCIQGVVTMTYMPAVKK